MSFEHNFWGERNNGFSVLYHNMKYELDNGEEFEKFLRESCRVEDNYWRQQANLAKGIGGTCTNRGSFAPYWLVVKTLVEKLSSIHQQLVSTWQELIRDVHKYNTDLQKKQREVKEQESSTQEAVQTIQQTISSLQRAKESYHTRCQELEKLRRENAAIRDLEKAEAKSKRAHDDYNNFIEKYSNNRNDFETSMRESCKRFQDLEEKHLTQMKEFVDAYAKSWENQLALLGQIHMEFQNSSQSLTVETLLETFVKNKGTGTDRPGTVEFVAPDLSTLPPASTPPDVDRKEAGLSDRRQTSDNLSQGSVESGASNTKTSTVGIDRTIAIRGLPFLRNKKDKKGKKHGQGKDKDETDTPSQNVQLDEEGYIIRTENPTPSYNHDSSDSSSESNSDQEDRRTAMPKVVIRPLTPGAANSIDNTNDLRNITWTIQQPLSNSHRRTPVVENSFANSSSPSDASTGTGVGAGNTSGKAIDDLIDLDLSGPTTYATGTSILSNENTSSPNDAEKNFSDARVPTPTGKDLSDSASTGNLDDSISALTQRHKPATPFGSILPPLLAGPLPPARNSRSSLPQNATARPSGRFTPDPFRSERTDSVSQINSVSSSSAFGTSRGPSPLTIGFTETIPVAVAFSENVQALFHGSDQNRCQMKLTGELIMSFPAGIVRVLTENSSPSTLTFRLKSCSNIEQIIANSSLITEDESRSSLDCRVYAFNMTSLVDHLRRQAEQNKTASYFNIDIVKYQVRTRPGIQSLPLHLVSSLSARNSQLEFQLDYKYNSAAFSQPCPLRNVGVLAQVEAPVLRMPQSQPEGSWLADSRRASWKLSDLSNVSESSSQGTVHATFDLASPFMPGVSAAAPVMTAIQFSADGSTLSSIDFELTGSGYRVSLVKKRFAAGKYLSSADVANIKAS